LDLDELKDLLQILDDKEIAEFELEEQGMKLRIRKAGASNHASPPPPLPAAAALAAAPPVVAVGTLPAPAPAAPPVVPAAEVDEGLLIVKSPIVGTFYRSPDPNSPVFVEIGQRIKPGQVLCIVEAMKLMNEIEAEASGVVVKAHPENGQPVQYGDPLFTIRPD
jgi:acetyl-CoA carboxylase biotin carboxyl carrier protein